MDILHVMPDFPCPANNGARADVWARLKAMRRLGHSIDVVVIAQKVVPEKRHLAELLGVASSLRFVERWPVAKCLATIAPTFVSCNRGLAELPLSREYDLTIMEAENAVPICDNPRLQTKSRVLRVHNNESSYMWGLARTEERFLRRQFLRFEAVRMARYSRLAYDRVDSLWFISQDECEKFIATHPKAVTKAVWFPASITLGDKPQRSSVQSKRVLSVGNFQIPFNRDGLRWYLNEVHPTLCHDPDYEFVVAGSTQGRPAAQSFVAELRQHKRCTVHVDVADPTSLYRESAVFVNTMQNGAGVKLKSIHAIQQGIPVVSTTVGNEGSGFLPQKHLLLADRPTEFVAAVAELLNNPRLRERLAAEAYRHLEMHYDTECNIGNLLAALPSRTSPLPIRERVQVSCEGA